MQKTRTRLWSVLLTVAMLLTLLPTTALADGEDTEGGTTTGTTQEDPAPETRVENPVAEIKSTGEEFETLAGAIAAAKDGDTVELLTDATVMERILLDGKNLTIDTNGCSVTYSGDAANTQAIIDLYGNSEVTITGDGAFTIDDNYLEYNGIGYTFRIYGNSRLTIENGTYYAGLTCVQAADNAIAYIEGGDFSASTDWNDVYWLLNLIDNSQAKFVVTGGSFENFDPAYSKTENPVANFCAEGYISTSTTDGTKTIYTVVALDEENSVAKVTGSGKTTYFETLPKAVAAAKDGDTVTLLENVDLTASGLTIETGKDLTLDLNGKEIKVASTVNGRILVNGHLTIEDSTDTDKDGTGTGKIYTETKYTGGATGYALLEASGTKAELVIDSGLIDASSFTNNPTNEGQFAVGVEGGATVTVTGGKITAGWYAISGNGTDTAATSTVNVQGGELISTADYAIYLPHQGITNITDGTIYGQAGGVALRRGELYISGDVLITSKGLGDTGEWGDGTGGMGNAALNVEADYGECIVEISGGKMTAEGDAVLIAAAAKNPVDITITGGTFSSNPKSYVAIGYEPIYDEATGTYTVTAKSGMEADASASGDSSSAEVGGNFTGNEGSESDNNVGVGNDGTIQVDVTTGKEQGSTTPQPNENVSSTEVKISSETLTSVNNNQTVASVDLVTDVATLTVDKQAWGTITDNAAGKAVTISVEETAPDAGIEAQWEVTAKAGNKDVFSGDTGATIKITVAYTAGDGASVEVYCLDNGQKVKSEYKDGSLTWWAPHFSTYGTVERSENSVASIAVDGGTPVYVDDWSGVETALANANKPVVITLYNDVDLPDTFTINGGKEVTLDLNGKTISGTSDATQNYALIRNYGDLTIMDSAENGKITFAYTGATSNWGYSSNTIDNLGKLTVESGTIENTTADLKTHIFFAIDNLSGNGIDAELIINGGTISCPNYRAIRQFANSATAQNSVTVNGGLIEGMIWLHIPHDDISKADLKIKDGKITGNNKSNVVVYVENYFDSSSAEATIVAIEGGIVDGEVVMETNDGAMEISGNANVTGDVRNTGKGTINVKDGTIGGDVNNNGTGKIAISGGTVNGTVNNNSIGTITVTGGTFPNDDVSEFLPEGEAFIVTFDPTEGQGTYIPVVATKDTQITLPQEPTAPYGYHFLGWSDGETVYAAGDSYKVTKTVTLKAVWVTNKYVVTFDANGGSHVSPQAVDYGSAAVEPDAPKRSGYRFTGWYLNGDLYDFDTPVTHNITLTAGWKKISSGSSNSNSEPTYVAALKEMTNGSAKVSPKQAQEGDEVTITVTPDEGYVVDEVFVINADGDSVRVYEEKNGTYTFTMPDSRVTIEVTFKAKETAPAVPTAPTGWVNPFTDVAANAWYYDAVGYANANGLMGGTSATTFAPNGAMNRSMVWTVIARLAGQTISGANWAEDAKAWAVAQGVSDGTNPDGNVTREELVTMLYRYIGSPVMNVPELGLINSYPDAASVSDWAQNALAWALSRGIIDGRDGKLASGESVTRAEAATILARFHLLTK